MPEVREHGPLPLILVLLTINSGLVDAFSYVELKVFVANMTGNVIILGLGFGGSGNVTGPAASTLFFCVGAAAGGHLAFARAAHRGVLLGTATIVQTGLLVAAALIETRFGHVDRLERHVLIAALAAAMVWQFAIVRRVGVPDYPTVVVTSPLAGLVADPKQPRDRAVRRSLSVGALVAGAAAGALLIRESSPTAPLWAGAALLLIVLLSLVSARASGGERRA